VRGRQKSQASMLAFVDPESLIPARHPIRAIRRLADEALAELSPLFEEMYAEIGRPSIPPEHLLKASLLMALYSVRSERAFCEQLSYNLLFRWFLGMDLLDPAFDHATFSKNRARLMAHKVGRELFDAIVGQAQRRHLLSAEHFTADGTLLEAAASVKSFKPRDGSGDRRATGRSGQPDGQLSGTEAVQRDTRQYDRPGSTVGAERTRTRGAAVVHGARADGEPSRPLGRLRGDRGDRHCRA